VTDPHDIEQVRTYDGWVQIMMGSSQI